MKNIFKIIITYGFGVILFTGCVKEFQFGKSDLKEVFYFGISQQVGNAEIVKDSLLIRLKVSSKADFSKLFLDSVNLSTYASIQPAVKEIKDFNNAIKYTVTAENGTKSVYTVFVSRETETPQLENGPLDNWYNPAGKTYFEPGLDASTIWASGNAGVVTLSTANVQPVTIAGSDKAAELVTKDLGALGQLVGQRMAAGSIFTGKFILDISNPLNSTKFGISFTARPKSFTLDYTYAPGTPYKSGTGQILSKSDSCDIYVVLENRDGAAIKRIATGWYRSGASVSQFTTLTVPITYGSLPASTPVYALPANGLFGNSNDPITHISFVASSSASGAQFEGGVNSKLTLNNIKLNY